MTERLPGNRLEKRRCCTRMPKMVLQVWSRRMGATVAWGDWPSDGRWPLRVQACFASRPGTRGGRCGERIAAQARSRGGSEASSACRLPCPLLTSAPRWRFLRTRSVRELPDTTRTSRGKTDRFHRTPAGFTTLVLDGHGLRGHWSARPAGRAGLVSGSCPSGRGFAPRFLQTPPRSDTPALRESFAAIRLDRGLARPSCWSCSAQKKRVAESATLLKA